MERQKKQLIRCGAIGLLLLASTGFSSIGCVTATPQSLPDAPLSSKKQQALRDYLIGSWERVYRQGERTNARLAQGQEFVWRFRKDGTGVYFKRVDPIDVSGKQQFEWSLDGRNLIMKSEGLDYKAYFRVQEWGDRRMVWYNYHLNNYYTVKRRDNQE